MHTWVSENKAKRGKGKAFHKLSYPADADYMNSLFWRCSNAVEAKDLGLQVRFWDERVKWLRMKVQDIRRATEKKGNDRCKVAGLEEVGFTYETSEPDGLKIAGTYHSFSRGGTLWDM